MKKLMLAGLDPELVTQLQAQLNTQYNIHCCNYGPDVVDEYLALLPELIVIDLSMPGCDTVSLLRSIQARGGQTQVLATACSYHSHIREQLSMLDAAFLLIRPFASKTIVKRLRQLEQLLPDTDDHLLSGMADEILQNMGLDSHSAGFPCLCSAILYKYHNPNCLFSSDLCVHVAKSCGGTASSVDKAMIRCIRKAQRRKDPVLWTHYLGSDHADITNTQFISALVHYIKIHVE